MKKSLIILVLLHCCLFIAIHAQTKETKKSTTFTNPIFPGDHPDPSILRDGKDYYMVHSSFEYYPGLLIWHSTDLVNWEPVTHALTKNLGSVWAPDLAKCNGKYYIYFPANGKNYVVWANSIGGPWSDPIDLKIGNIDPGHFTDKEGKRYLYFSDGSYVPLADDGLSVSGKPVMAYSGWPIPRDWVIECFCLEGPKVMKHGEYYYLTVAEGGTSGPATSHLVISARSKSPLGPWENSPYNPIVRTFSKNERWLSKGHATLIDDAAGKWWMIYHSYENGFYGMGRQTLLQSIEWTSDGWFKSPAGLKIDQPIALPAGAKTQTRYDLSDNFSGNKLRAHWQFYRQYDTTRFSVRNNSLSINTKGNHVGECSPLLCIPQDHSYDVQVEMEMEGSAKGALVLFYNDRTFSGIAADKDNIFSIIRDWTNPTEKKSGVSHVYLKLQNRNHLVNMYYSLDGKKWQKIENSLEVSGYHHNALGGFMSLRIGLCSIGTGKVIFRNFKYNAVK